MHELSVCQALVEQAVAVARQHDGRVRRLVLKIGPLSGVEPELLRRAFPLASAGTEVEDAELEIQSLAPRIRCGECGQESEVPANRLVCPHCRNWRTTLVSGDEMVLQQVELERHSREAAPAATPLR